MITLGLSEIKVGEAAPDGSMPLAAALTKIGETYKDSCKINQEKAEVQEHFEEGKSAPRARNKTKKIPVLTLSLMNPDPTMLAAYVGGEVDGTSWGYNGDEVVANKSIQVVTKQGLNYEIPNADIEAVLNGDLSEKGIVLVDLTITPMAVTSGKAFRAVPKT